MNTFFMLLGIFGILLCLGTILCMILGSISVRNPKYKIFATEDGWVIYKKTTYLSWDWKGFEQSKEKAYYYVLQDIQKDKHIKETKKIKPMVIDSNDYI